MFILAANLCHAQNEDWYDYHMFAAGVIDHDSYVIFDTDNNHHGAITIGADSKEFFFGQNWGVYTSLVFDLENQYGTGAGVIFIDARKIQKKGIEYGGSGYVNALHSLTDKEYVDTEKPKLVNLSSDPANQPDGYIYYNTSLGKIRVKLLGSWFSLALE